MEMKLLNDTKYFKVKEILYSKTAEQNNIDNIPTDEDIINNLQFTLNYLDEIREGYGKPIYINSGYRCPELNKLVGGVKNSYHQSGLGVDLRWDKELFEYIMDNCVFDKLIREKSGKTFWIHLQLKRNTDDCRGQVLTITA